MNNGGRTARIVAGTALGGMLLFAPAAGAQTNPDYVGRTPPQVAGTVIERTAAAQVTETPAGGGEVVRPRVAAAGATTVGASRAANTGLAVTGGDVAGLVALGLGALGAGSVLVRRSRARSA